MVLEQLVELTHVWNSRVIQEVKRVITALVCVNCVNVRFQRMINCEEAQEDPWKKLPVCMQQPAPVDSCIGPGP